MAGVEETKNFPFALDGKRGGGETGEAAFSAGQFARWVLQTEVELLAAFAGFPALSHNLAKVRHTRLRHGGKLPGELHLNREPDALVKTLGKFFEES